MRISRTAAALAVIISSLYFLSPLLGQGDRATITGTVTDSSGAVIPGATVTLVNENTGAKAETVTTDTGNYTVPQLPVGTYTLTFTKEGFTRYQRTGVQAVLAVTSRVDVVLAVGQTVSAVEVHADASLLKTENAEQSTTITKDQIAELPINFGIGGGAIRNPLSFVQMTPGAYFNGWNNISINGGSVNFKIMFEGQQSDDPQSTQMSDESQPSVEAIQEFTLQTSNLAPEFGGAGGGGIFNFVSKSGTNKFHGSAYSYIQNTVFNAGIPFTDDGTGRHVQQVKHYADYGASLGGPVRIPRLYDGRNKTFFFFNLERYRDRRAAYNGVSTVPNSAMLAGDLSRMLTVANANLGKDVAGRTLIQNSIYDPATETFDSSGRRILNPFPGNIIPQNRFDPTAKKIMALLPKPNIGNDLYVNNFALSGDAYKLQQIPSLKIDHNIGSKTRLFGYYSWQNTTKTNGVDGLSPLLSMARIQGINSKTARVGIDETLSPTMIFHLALGFQRHVNPDFVAPEAANYDATQLGITNAPGLGFPQFASGTIGDNVYGGMNVGFGAGQRSLMIGGRLSVSPSLSWVRGNHTLKTGADWKYETYTREQQNNTNPNYTFSNAQTAQPLYGTSLPAGTQVGSGWASFLLGQYSSVRLSNGQFLRYQRPSWALYVQDSWKVTRKLTVEYGLRWDLQVPIGEQHDRMSTFSPTAANPNAGGLPGGVIYAGNGDKRCNCSLIPAYPYAFGPRLSVAYQPIQKTVLRAGWGITYAPLTILGGNVPGFSGMGSNVINVNAPGENRAAGILSQPLVYDAEALYGATYDAGLNVAPGAALQAAPALVDRNGGRPARVMQWNISLQREVLTDLLVEAAYVGNRAVWVNAGNAQGYNDATVGNLVSYNSVSPDVLARYGLSDLTVAANRTLLNSAITSAAAKNAGFTLPYAGFPTTATVLQSLRPYPQYTAAGIAALYAPLGHTWYDALQVKVTKRLSHNFYGSAAYSFSKTLDSTSNDGNIYDRESFKGLSPNYYPHIFSFNAAYTVPAAGFARKSRMARAVLSDWRITTLFTIQSGDLLTTPASTNGLANFLATGYGRQVRVPDVPLYLKNVNGDIDPTQETVLNPKAWQDQAAGVPGSTVRYYNDFRGPRRPGVSGGLGKAFRIRERASFSIRAEFFNLFNFNEVLRNPGTGSNPSVAPTRSASTGMLTGGFGYMNYTASSDDTNGRSPRTGQIVARFEF